MLPFSATALFCNDLMEELERNPATRIMWKSVKPLLMGQILYAPDSPAVRQIIRNVSHMTKVFYGRLWWANCTEVGKLRPGGHMWPGGLFNSARGAFTIYFFKPNEESCVSLTG